MAGPLPRRVLVVRLGAIGDVVNALVFASALKAADPAVRVGWAAHDLVLPLVVNNPVVDRVHHWPRGAGLRGGLGLRDELRAERYDCAVDLQRILKSATLARLSGARRVVGFDRARTKEGAWLLTNDRVPPGPSDEHMVDRYLAVARHLGASAERPTWSLSVDDDAEAVMEARFGAHAPLLVNLGASKPPNRWTDAGWTGLVRALAERGDAQVVLTGGPDDRELFARTLEDLEGTRGVVDLVGRTDLLELAALAKRARAMVTCDTGPMHLAVACGLRVVALFGPADPARTGPYGERHAVVRPPGGSTATRDVRVEDVLSAL